MATASADLAVAEASESWRVCVWRACSRWPYRAVSCVISVFASCSCIATDVSRVLRRGTREKREISGVWVLDCRGGCGMREGQILSAG